MTLVDWLAVYEQDPLDFSLLLPWSDWCLEQGDERSAACLLWCHRHERAPDHFSGRVSWEWWDLDLEKQYPGSRKTPGDLPGSLFRQLPHAENHVVCYYRNAHLALLALLTVWQKHPLLPCRHPACCMVGDPQDPPDRDVTLSCALCAWTPAEVTA